MLNLNKNKPEIWLNAEKAEYVKTLHHETMATLAGYRRGATTLCHNPARSAALAYRDSTCPLQSACRRYATTGAHPHASGDAHATHTAATVGQQ